MDDRVIIGHVAGLYGLRGWVKVFSHTEPRDGITRYQPLYLKIHDDWRQVQTSAGRRHGKSVVLKFTGVDDRDAAASLIGADIAIERTQLPPLAPDEFYWSDLQGLQVSTIDGIDLGVVDYLMATGANDVLVVKGERERLIPFLRDQVVVDIDLQQRRMRVDWDADF